MSPLTPYSPHNEDIPTWARLTYFLIKESCKIQWRSCGQKYVLRIFDQITTNRFKKTTSTWRLSKGLTKRKTWWLYKNHFRLTPKSLNFENILWDIRWLKISLTLTNVDPFAGNSLEIIVEHFQDKRLG